MAEDKYAANWRGARRYQFDEEARLKQATLTSSAQPAPVEMWPIDTGRDRDLIDPETSDMIASGQPKEASTLSLWAFAITVGVIAFAVAYRFL